MEASEQNQIKFSLIHPSRGRSVQAFEAYKMWTKIKSPLEYILSVDVDDPQLNNYKRLFEGHANIVISNNKNLVQAVDKGAKVSTGDVLIVVSDDFHCPEDWDEKILSVIDRDVFAIVINDTITKPEQKVMTLPIVSRSLYEKLGYIYYPEYTGMFADNDLYEAADTLGAVIHADIIFEHRHWVNGKAKRDATYNRHDNTHGWNLGKALITERRKNNFDL